MMKTLRIETEEKLVEYWEKDWIRHHKRVRDFFSKNSGNYFEFDLNKDGSDVFIKNIN